MNMHAVFIRGILIVAFSMGLCVAMIHRAYTPRPLQITAAAVPARITAPRIVGQPAAVVLPTIRVRPTAADIAAALESTDDVAAAAYIEAASVAPLGGRASLPGLHLDMPYYSFGKTLPRVSKE
jgi:hypothetical protein